MRVHLGIAMKSAKGSGRVDAPAVAQSPTRGGKRLTLASAPVVESLERRAMLAGDLPVVSMSAIDGAAAEVGRDPGVVRVSRTGPTDTPLAVGLGHSGATVYNP